MGFLWWGQKKYPSGPSRRFDKGVRHETPTVEPMEERTFWQEHGGLVAFSLLLGCLGLVGVVGLSAASDATYYVLGVGFPLFMTVCFGMMVGGFCLPLKWYDEYTMIRSYKVPGSKPTASDIAAEFSDDGGLDPVEAVASVEKEVVEAKD